jgi:dipeptidase D
MYKVLSELEPNMVFKYFEEITRIPRGTGNENAISNYMVEFAKEHNLEVVQDKALNIIIRKNGTTGYENNQTVVLQGHMDMVNVKDIDVEHNFIVDPIKLRIIDDMIYANGTTLGADNGIAIAYCLAILDSDDIPHPPIEVLLTTEEETGMDGAMELNVNEIRGSILINMDSEEEGSLLVSCAGGATIIQKLLIDYVEITSEKVLCSVSIIGLKGGHSGAEIDKGRGNAIKLLGRVLNDLYNGVGLLINKLNGGVKMNAIPCEAYSEIIVDKNDLNKIKNIIYDFNAILRNELRNTDPDVCVQFIMSEKKIKQAFSKVCTEKVIESILLIPNGIQSMSRDIDGLVESSTNLGTVVTENREVCFKSCVRSSIKSLKYAIINQLKIVSKVLEEEFIIESEYPEWEYNPESKIREIFEKVYKQKYNKNPKISATHGGVECGLIIEKKKEIDAISFGPNIYDVHTTNEHISITSIKRTWELLINVLKEIE